MYVGSNPDRNREKGCCMHNIARNAQKDGTIQAVTLLDAVKMDISKKASLAFNKGISRALRKYIDTAQKKLNRLSTKISQAYLQAMARKPRLKVQQPYLYRQLP